MVGAAVCQVMLCQSMVRHDIVSLDDGCQRLRGVWWIGCDILQYDTVDRGDCEGGHECQRPGGCAEHSGDSSARTARL